MSQTSAHGWVRLAGIAGFALLLGSTAPSASAAAAEQLNYRITHAMFGDIGTYSNTVEPSGDATTVKTRTHIAVKLLGVNVYHEDARRTEEWEGGRLVAFHGVTESGKGSTEVQGVARGNSFVISTPQGTITAPANVHPANPWSANFIRSQTMMRPDTGKLEQVSVSGGDPSLVTIDHKTIAARRYQVNGKTRYTVWLDSRGVPVKFAVKDSSGTVTFTLTQCSNCGLAMSDTDSAKQMASQQ